CRDAVRNHPGAAEVVDQLSRHLAANQLAADRARFTVGPWIDLDPASGAITAVAGADNATLTRARALAEGTHRAPYRFDA
ncbi:MAG: hypothetical protein ACKPB0_11460, partial [Opitutaceae bacterium]